MAKYNLEYRYSAQFGTPTHLWTIIGRDGGLSLRIMEYKSDNPKYSGGLEIHRRAPMAGDNSAPSFGACWLLQCPCWHDGTSLYVTETLIPLWLAYDRDNDSMFRLMQHEYANRFEKAADE